MPLDQIEQTLCELTARYLRVPSHAVARNVPLKQQGLDSLGLLDLLCDIQESFLLEDIHETPVALQQFNTIEKIAAKLATLLLEDN